MAVFSKKKTENGSKPGGIEIEKSTSTGNMFFARVNSSKLQSHFPNVAK